MQKTKRPNGMAIYLGNDAEFEGNLKFYGTAIIQGQLKGNISGEGKLEIDKNAKIEADIYAPTIIIYGEVHGNIYASEKVEIKVPGKVFGYLEAPVFTIEAGAVFQGECHTQKPKVAEKDESEIKRSVKIVDFRTKEKTNGPIEVLP